MIITRIGVVAILLLLAAFTAGARAEWAGLSVHLGAGASKVTGELFEDTDYKAIYGIDLTRSLAGKLSVGLHAGYTEWSPDVVPELPGASRMVEGTARNTEVLAIARYDMAWDRSGRLSLFGEAGFGYCFIDSDIKVYSRPVVPDPGPYEFLYSIDSQNEPCVNAGLGLTYRFAARFGLEFFGDYSYIFTDDDPLKYYSVNGGLVIRI